MASVTLVFAGREERTFQLDKPRLVVGRDATTDIPIDNLGISRQHCAFMQKGEVFTVQDLGSANGTFVNGRKVTEHYLNHGDEIELGKFVLRFRNEAQAGPEGAGESAPVPDTANTYMMDGSKIQEQLAKMRGATVTAPVKPGATAKDYAKAFDVPGGPPDAAARMKNLVMLLAVVVVIETAALAVLIVMLALGKFAG
jgi:pSer/pThr/pTyr-binding forkhead associated (FHA) protein